MSECSICKVTKPDVEERLGRTSCLKCAQDRYARTLSSYVIAMSEEATGTACGWSTALCAYRVPVPVALSAHPKLRRRGAGLPRRDSNPRWWDISDPLITGLTASEPAGSTSWPACSPLEA